MKQFVFMRRYETGQRPRLMIWMSIFLIALPVLLTAGRAGAGPVPSAIVAMPGQGSTVLLVEKSSQTLYVYRLDTEPVLVRSLPCSTGKTKGRKQVSGDQKTPEGVYFFVGKYLDKDLAPIYGVMALPMDYPNLLDQHLGRNGSAIWMHGTDKALKPMDSNGCVALENQQLEMVAKEISLDLTPIIISEKIDFTDGWDHGSSVAAMDSFLARWAGSLSGGDYHEFLGHYAPEYCPPMNWWNDWRSIRDGAGNEAGPFAFTIENRGIYRDGDVFVVLFRLNLTRGGQEQHVGIRKLYVADHDGTYKIVGDSHKLIQPPGEGYAKDARHRSPLIWAANRVLDLEKKKRVAQVEGDIRQTIDVWLNAWIRGDIERYGLCYADGFSSGDLDKQAWLERKTYLSRVYDYIDIVISNPVVTIDGNRAHANFKQTYTSSGYSATGQKTLVLVNEGKTWKILHEIWKKN